MRSETLAEKIANRIVDMIREENILPGDKIPTEQRLAELFQVSRTTVREAERRLASRNVLEIRQGSGAYVSHRKGIADDPLGFSMEQDKVRLCSDLMKMRIYLEPHMAELAAVHATRDDIYRLWEIEERMEQMDADENETWDSLELSFHIGIADAAHNLAARRIVPILEEGFHVIAGDYAASPDRNATIESHRAILNSIEQHNTVEAKNNMFVHLMLMNHDLPR